MKCLVCNKMFSWKRIFFFLIIFRCFYGKRCTTTSNNSLNGVRNFPIERKLKSLFLLTFSVSLFINIHPSTPIFLFPMNFLKEPNKKKPSIVWYCVFLKNQFKLKIFSSNQTESFEPIKRSNKPFIIKLVCWGHSPRENIHSMSLPSICIWSFGFGPRAFWFVGFQFMLRICSTMN